MKQFSVNIPTSKSDLYSLCESAGRKVRRMRVNTGVTVVSATHVIGVTIQNTGDKLGSFVADKGYNLGNTIACGSLRGSTSFKDAHANTPTVKA